MWEPVTDVNDDTTISEESYRRSNKKTFNIKLLLQLHNVLMIMHVTNSQTKWSDGNVVSFHDNPPKLLMYNNVRDVCMWPMTGMSYKHTVLRLSSDWKGYNELMCAHPLTQLLKKWKSNSSRCFSKTAHT